MPDIRLVGLLFLSLAAASCSRGQSSAVAIAGSATSSVATSRPSASEEMVVRPFFSDLRRDPGMLDCRRTYPFERRVPRSPRVGEAAIRELLRGPTPEERERGAQTSIPDGTRLISLSIEDSVATVNLSRDLVQGVAGSCRVSAIRSQIEQTLLVFPTVKRVRILVEGADAEPLLQP